MSIVCARTVTVMYAIVTWAVAWITLTHMKTTPWFRQLYFWVLAAIVLGIAVGYFWPHTGQNLEPLGTTFINAIKMMITPIIFLTVVSGIAGVDDLRRVGR